MPMLKYIPTMIYVKYLPQPALLVLATQSSLRFDLLPKVCGFSILKPVKTFISNNISDLIQSVFIQMTVCIYPLNKKECNISYF